MSSIIIAVISYTFGLTESRFIVLKTTCNLKTTSNESSTERSGSDRTRCQLQHKTNLSFSFLHLRLDCFIVRSFYEKVFHFSVNLRSIKTSVWLKMHFLEHSQKLQKHSQSLKHEMNRQKVFKFPQNFHQL